MWGLSTDQQVGGSMPGSSSPPAEVSLGIWNLNLEINWEIPDVFLLVANANWSGEVIAEVEKATKIGEGGGSRERKVTWWFRMDKISF